MLVTSVILEDTPEDALDMVAVGDGEAWRVRFPRLSVSPPGAGDLTASVFLANVLDGHTLADALGRTASSVFAVVAATAEAGEREMRIVQTQDALADPRVEFEVTPLS